jgi:hypothetical protein
MLIINSASCGLHYHTIIEERERPSNLSNCYFTREDFHDHQMIMECTKTKKRKFEDLAVGDEMSHFKRVRVIIKKVKINTEQDIKPLLNQVLDV